MVFLLGFLLVLLNKLVSHHGQQEGQMYSVLATTSVVDDVTREVLVLNAVLTVCLLRQG